MLGNAILQVLRSGCPWRLRPHDFPPWSTVYQHCRKWRDEGLWAEGMHAVRHQERQRRDRAPAPPRAVISDSQSVKTTAKGGRVATLPIRTQAERQQLHRPAERPRLTGSTTVE